MTTIPLPFGDTPAAACEHSWEQLRYITLDTQRRRTAERWRDDRCILCGEIRRLLDPPATPGEPTRPR